MNKRCNAGFSLIELSIVIIVIGLVIASILGGINVLNSAKIRSVISDISKYKDAISTFQTMYNGLPGDIAWEAAPFSATTGTTLTAGNGDGVITWNNTTHPTTSQEAYQAWLHLEAAKLISGNYTGVPASDNAAVIGVNIPGSKVESAGYSFVNFDIAVGGGNDASQFYTTPPSPVPMDLVGNYIAFGATAVNSYTSGAAISLSTAVRIESKMDDGSPDSGIVLATPGTFSPIRCVTVVDAATNDIQYDTADSEDLVCNLYFKLQ